MNIVLLGGSGFVGRNLLPVLTARGHNCTVLTRNAERCRELRLVPRLRLLQVDVFDGEALSKALAGAGAALNLIGILNEKGRSGKGFHRVHVELTESLLESCRLAGVSRLIYVSALNAGIDHPNASHYLKTKGEAERLIRAATDIDSTIVQPSVMFGESDSFFNRFAALLQLTPVLPLACPEARMQPVWVRDVTEAMARMLERRDSVGETYPAVGPRAYSLLELVRFTACAMGRRRWIIGLPDGLSRLQALVCDFVPGKPFSTDNYRSLQIPNVSAENGLLEYGIEPHPLEGLVRHYLGGSSRQQRLNAIRQRSGHRP